MKSTQPLNIPLPASPYRALIGVGGIGTGRFIALQGNHTLGREESRAVRFLDYRDYCKLHIITHYVKTLLGADFATLLLGKVGADEVGYRLIDEMRDTGLDIRYVEAGSDLQTLNAICFLYPDGSGGNLTTENSACSHVDAPFVSRAESEFERFQGHGIALAAPEVPLSARRRLLELATQYQFLRTATFVSGEMQEAVTTGLIDLVDVLSINLDEAAAIVGLSPETNDPVAVVEPALHQLLNVNASLRVCITAGRSGSWSWDGESLAHVPAVPVHAVSTAGAGDAFLASLIIGFVANLPFQDAQQLAALVAAVTVTSPHTIHPQVDRTTLAQFARERGLALPPSVSSLLHS